MSSKTTRASALFGNTSREQHLCNGNTHTGSFTLNIYDPSGTFQTEVADSVTGERISVE
jgi:hypothetical protein